VAKHTRPTKTMLNKIIKKFLIVIYTITPQGQNPISKISKLIFHLLITIMELTFIKFSL